MICCAILRNANLLFPYAADCTNRPSRFCDRSTHCRVSLLKTCRRGYNGCRLIARVTLTARNKKAGGSKLWLLVTRSGQNFLGRVPAQVPQARRSDPGTNPGDPAPSSSLAVILPVRTTILLSVPTAGGVPPNSRASMLRS